MAFNVTPVRQGNSSKSWVVEAGADADETVLIPHGYGTGPSLGSITPLSFSNAQVAINRTCGWSFDMGDSVNIKVRKSTDAGTAGGVCLVCVYVPVFPPVFP